MRIFSIILMIVWIPFIYFVIDKKLSAFFTRKFKLNETSYDINTYGVGVGGAFASGYLILFGAPVVFITQFGDTFNLDYIIWFAVVTFLEVLIGTLERINYKK